MDQGQVQVSPQSEFKKKAAALRRAQLEAAAAAVSTAEAAAAAAALLAFVNDDPCDGDYDGDVLLMSEYGNAEAADLAAPSDTLWFIHTPLAVAPAQNIQAEATDPAVGAPAEIPEHSRLPLAPSTPPRFQPPSSTQDSPTSVLESERLHEIERAVAVALKSQHAVREAESLKQTELLCEMRQWLLNMSKSNDARVLNCTAEFEQKFAAASLQTDEQSRLLQQLLLNMAKSNSAPKAPEVSEEQLEAAAETKLMWQQSVASTSEKIFKKIFSPPVAHPVFSESPGNSFAEVTVFCATIGATHLLLPEKDSLQSIVDIASKMLPRTDIDMRASQLNGLGARMAHGGVLSEDEAKSTFVQSVRDAAKRCSEAATAFVQAASPANSTMRTMLERSVILQQGQPGIGPLRALAVVLEPYKAESQKTKADLFDMEADLKSVFGPFGQKLQR